MSNNWLQSDAIKMCKAIEGVCPQFGCHIALTGGLLYKSGPRKDADILFYCIRKWDEIDMDGLIRALAKLGMEFCTRKGWVVKGKWDGKPVDMFFPEAYPASSIKLSEGEY